MFVTYDPALPFPQDALFGRGVVQRDGTHTPPASLASYKIDPTTDLPEGNDERYAYPCHDAWHIRKIRGYGHSWQWPQSI